MEFASKAASSQACARALSREASDFGRRLIEWDDEAGEALQRRRLLSAAWVYAALLTLLSVSNAC